MGEATSLLAIAIASERAAWLKVRAWPPGTRQHDPRAWAAWQQAAEDLAKMPMRERAEAQPETPVASTRSNAAPTNPLWTTRWN